jgi:2-keto-4-pentenoate hydratase
VKKPWLLREVIEAVGSVHAGIEVAECRFPLAALPRLPAVLADGSASGRYVFGSSMPDWAEGLASVQVKLWIDGKAERHGSGAAVMGDPLRPLLWLAEERRIWGDGLRAGETISTGSMTGMLPIRAGQQVRAEFGGTAVVEIGFDA